MPTETTNMSKKDIPIGKRFSLLYIERGVPQKDSERFRIRLAAFFKQYLEEFNRYDIGAGLERELGVEIPSIYNYGYDIPKFFKKAELRDVLDSITLIWRYLSNKDSLDANNWRDSVQIVLIQENLGYRLDEKAGVHFFVDSEFEKNRLSVLSCLESSKYTAVAHEFEKSHSKLESEPPETKEAIRAVFEAVEILYKLITDAPKGSRLNSQGVRAKLKPIVQIIYQSDSTALKASEHLLDGLCDWIDAGHMYRHGQKVKEPNDPPIEIAIQMISTGASFLRWLVEIDNLNRATKA